MKNIDGLKQEIIEGGLRLVREGLAERTWGNIQPRQPIINSITGNPASIDAKLKTAG